MDGPVSVLAQIDFIDVGIQEVGFVEMRLENYRHDGFTHLAPERASIVEKITFYELLGQRTAALSNRAGANICHECP